MRVNFLLKLTLVVLTFSMACGPASQQPIFSSSQYQLYPDRVVQGKYVSKAVAATELISNYQSPANPYSK